ncbi:hypothetical protein [Thermococcus sp. JCM 11816]|uniref:hypothetical protein n=1 Tax=Thermococcus sp. (strain JCM 11816 / KS-1) TaxID=1295125 RepID=UPI000AFC57E0
MKLPVRTLARLAVIYLCVLLIIVLIAGATSNKLTWDYAHDALMGIRMNNPALYQELEQNATREGGLTVEEYYYHILTKAAEVRDDNIFVMGIDLLRKSIDYYRRGDTKYDFNHSIKVTLMVMGLSVLLTVFLSVLLGFKLANSRFLGVARVLRVSSLAFHHGGLEQC